MIKQTLLASCFLTLLSSSLWAQPKKKPAPITKTPKTAPAKATVKPGNGPVQFKKTASGVEYKFLVDNPSTTTIGEGSVVKMHIRTLVADSAMFDTYKMNNNEPIEQPMSSQFIGPFWDAFVLLTPGDSAILRLPIDSAFKGAPSLPPFAKSGDHVQWVIKVFSVKSKEEADAEKEKLSKVQNDIDDKLIRQYIKDKGIKALKTASGIYYVIDRTGNGKHAVAADKVKVHYKGYKMDGSTFDSSYERNAPIDFPLMNVIRGWTEGIPLFEEGGKGTLLIPSSLAYGQNPPPGSTIKANEVLLFDVELLEINPKSAEPVTDPGVPAEKN